jgi:tagatose-1,6-bisphosphate aldolase
LTADLVCVPDEQREDAIVAAARELGALRPSLYKCQVPLAGRGVWTSSLAADDPAELLRSDSVPRLEQLGATVDTHGRPWRDK